MKYALWFYILKAEVRCNSKSLGQSAAACGEVLISLLTGPGMYECRANVTP